MYYLIISKLQKFKCTIANMIEGKRSLHFQFFKKIQIFLSLTNKLKVQQDKNEP